MAQKEVDAWLQTLRGAAQDFRGAGEAFQQQGQLASKQNYLSSLRQNLIDAGIGSSQADIVAEGAASGDPKFAEAANAALLKRALPDASKAQLTESQLTTHPGLNRLDKKLTPDEIKAMASYPRDQQDKAISELTSMNTAAGRQKLGEENLSFRKGAKDFTDPFTARRKLLEKGMDEHDKAISAGQDALDKINQGSQPSAAAALGFLVKATGERVNEQAIKRFMGSTMYGSTTSWQNYFDNGAKTPLSPDNLAALKTAFTESMSNIEKLKQTRINEAVNDVSSYNGSVDAFGHPRQEIQSMAKRYGRTYNPETKQFESAPTTSKLTGAYAQAAQGAAKLPADKKDQAIKLIQSYQDSGKAIPPQVLQKLGVAQ